MNQMMPKHTVFAPKEDFNSNYFRIPFLEITNSGTLIAGADVRYVDNTDFNTIDLGIARSTDDGQTWTDKQIVHARATDHAHSRKMDGAILVDRHTGRIFLFALGLDLHWHLDATDNEHQSFMYKYSDDDGLTWSEEISLRHFYDEDAILFFQGPGNGIQLEDGTLVLPIQRWVSKAHPIQVQAGILYSKDHGATWHQSETLIPLRSSESAVVEYEANKVMISCRDDFSTGRHFYTTADLGTTWVPHETTGTVWENGGCQAAMIKIKAPNGKSYGLYATPQHTSEVIWDRRKITLMATDDFIKWNAIAEIHHESTDGYSCFAYDDKKQKLYLLTERQGTITLNDISHFLPLIMQNTPTYDNQYIGVCHKQPLYARGHYISTTKAGAWYHLANIKLKKTGYALAKLDLMGLSIDATLTLKMRQTLEDAHDMANCSLKVTDLSGAITPEHFILVPTALDGDYFSYDVYYNATFTDEFVSISVVNCNFSDRDYASLKITTMQRDVRYEKYTLETPAHL